MNTWFIPIYFLLAFAAFIISVNGSPLGYLSRSYDYINARDLERDDYIDGYRNGGERARNYGTQQCSVSNGYELDESENVEETTSTEYENYSDEGAENAYSGQSDNWRDTGYEDSVTETWGYRGSGEDGDSKSGNGPYEGAQIMSSRLHRSDRDENSVNGARSLMENHLEENAYLDHLKYDAIREYESGIGNDDSYNKITEYDRGLRVGDSANIRPGNYRGKEITEDDNSSFESGGTVGDGVNSNSKNIEGADLEDIAFTNQGNTRCWKSGVSRSNRIEWDGNGSDNNRNELKNSAGSELEKNVSEKDRDNPESRYYGKGDEGPSGRSVDAGSRNRDDGLEIMLGTNFASDRKQDVRYRAVGVSEYNENSYNTKNYELDDIEIAREQSENGKSEVMHEIEGRKYGYVRDGAVSEVEDRFRHNADEKVEYGDGNDNEIGRVRYDAGIRSIKNTDVSFIDTTHNEEDRQSGDRSEFVAESEKGNIIPKVADPHQNAMLNEDVGPESGWFGRDNSDELSNRKKDKFVDDGAGNKRGVEPVNGEVSRLGNRGNGKSAVMEDSETNKGGGGLRNNMNSRGGQYIFSADSTLGSEEQESRYSGAFSNMSEVESLSVIDSTDNVKNYIDISLEHTDDTEVKEIKSINFRTGRGDIAAGDGPKIEDMRELDRKICKTRINGGVNGNEKGIKVGDRPEVEDSSGSREKKGFTNKTNVPSLNNSSVLDSGRTGHPNSREVRLKDDENRKSRTREDRKFNKDVVSEAERDGSRKVKGNEILNDVEGSGSESENGKGELVEDNTSNAFVNNNRGKKRRDKNIGLNTAEGRETAGREVISTESVTKKSEGVKVENHGNSDSDNKLATEINSEKGVRGSKYRAVSINSSRESEKYKSDIAVEDVKKILKDRRGNEEDGSSASGGSADTTDSGVRDMFEGIFAENRSGGDGDVARSVSEKGNSERVRHSTRSKIGNSETESIKHSTRNKYLTRNDDKMGQELKNVDIRFGNTRRKDKNNVSVTLENGRVARARDYNNSNEVVGKSTNNLFQNNKRQEMKDNPVSDTVTIHSEEVGGVVQRGTVKSIMPAVRNEKNGGDGFKNITVTQLKKSKSSSVNSTSEEGSRDTGHIHKNSQSEKVLNDDENNDKSGKRGKLERVAIRHSNVSEKRVLEESDEYGEGKGIGRSAEKDSEIIGLDNIFRSGSGKNAGDEGNENRNSTDSVYESGEGVQYMKGRQNSNNYKSRESKDITEKENRNHSNMESEKYGGGSNMKSAEGANKNKKGFEEKITPRNALGNYDEVIAKNSTGSGHVITNSESNNTLGSATESGKRGKPKHDASKVSENARNKEVKDSATGASEVDKVKTTAGTIAKGKGIKNTSDDVRRSDQSGGLSDSGLGHGRKEKNGDEGIEMRTERSAHDIKSGKDKGIPDSVDGESEDDRGKMYMVTPITDKGRAVENSDSVYESARTPKGARNGMVKNGEGCSGSENNKQEVDNEKCIGIENKNRIGPKEERTGSGSSNSEIVGVKDSRTSGRSKELTNSASSGKVRGGHDDAGSRFGNVSIGDKGTGSKFTSGGAGNKGTSTAENVERKKI